MKTITLTDEQYQALLNGESVTIEPPKKEIKKWEPKGGNYFVTPYGQVGTGQTMVKTRNFGLEYQTKEQAEKARDAMGAHNRLLAWLAENDDGWVADWENTNQRKYTLYYSHHSKNWVVTSDLNTQDLSRIYMSEQNAMKLYKLLKDGLIEL